LRPARAEAVTRAQRALTAPFVFIHYLAAPESAARGRDFR
jgi:hypothetical protein